MARRGILSPKKRKKKATKKKNGLLDKSLRIGAQTLGSGAVGFAHGAVEEGIGEEAATYARWGGMIAGIAGLALIDEKESPIWHAFARTLLIGSATLEGEQYGKRLVQAWREFKEEERGSGTEAAKNSEAMERLTAVVISLQDKLDQLERRQLEADMGGQKALNGTGEPMGEEVQIPARASA